MPSWASRLLRGVAIAALIAGPVGGIWSPPSVEAEGASAIRDGAAVYQSSDAPQAPQTVGGGMIMAPGTSSPRAGDFQTNAIGPWLTTLNELRALANLPPVADNDALTQGETNHSKYIVKNNVLTHPEPNDGNIWRTDIGNDAGNAGNISASGNLNFPETAFIDGLMTGAFHGVAFIDPKLQTSAFGVYRENLEPSNPNRFRSAVTVDKDRGRTGPGLSGNQFVFWPADGKVLPFTNFPGNEDPNPLTSTGCSAFTAPTGPPLYLLLASVPNVSSISFTRGGTSLQTCSITETTYTNPNGATQTNGRNVLAARHAIIVLPRAPLDPGTAYRLQVVTNGQTLTTNFTTAASGDRQPVVLGKVTANGNAQANAKVQACVRDGSGNPIQPCVRATTDSAGAYSISGLVPGNYQVIAYPNPESTTLGQSAPVNINFTQYGQVFTAELALAALQPPPAGTVITTTRPATAGGVPVQTWRDTTPISTTGSGGCQVTWRLEQAGTTVATGATAEGPAGTYKGTIPALFPLHGAVQLKFILVCGGATQPVKEGGSIFIDPSGLVRDLSGNPIVGATVTLFRSDTANGTFTQVANGDGTIMSPSNTKNPDVTDTNGAFGWDVIAGYYKVRASKAGCTAPGGQAFVETSVLPIPPPVTNLDLRLNCRGQVRVAVSTISTGKRVDVTAGVGDLTQLRFALNPNNIRSTSWTVTATEGTFAVANGIATLTLPSGRTSTSFLVARTGAGPVTISFVAVDGGGDWPTFIGASAASWGAASSRTESAVDPADVANGRVIVSGPAR